MLYPALVIVFHLGEPLNIIVACILGAMALYAHRSNIARLINKNENRLDFKKINEISKKKHTK